MLLYSKQLSSFIGCLALIAASCSSHDLMSAETIPVTLRSGWNSVSFVFPPSKKAIEDRPRITRIVGFSVNDARKNVEVHVWTRTASPKISFDPDFAPPLNGFKFEEGEQLDLSSLEPYKGYLVFVTPNEEQAQQKHVLLETSVAKLSKPVGVLPKTNEWKFVGYPVGDYISTSRKPQNSRGAETPILALLAAKSNEVSLFYLSPCFDGSHLPPKANWRPEKPIAKNKPSEHWMLRQNEAVWISGKSSGEDQSKEPEFETIEVLDFRSALTSLDVAIDEPKGNLAVAYQLTSAEWFFHKDIIAEPKFPKAKSLEGDAEAVSKYKDQSDKYGKQIGQIITSLKNATPKGFESLTEDEAPLLGFDSAASVIPFQESRNLPPKYSGTIRVSLNRLNAVAKILKPGCYAGKLNLERVDLKGKTWNRKIYVVFQVPQIYGGYVGVVQARALSFRGLNETTPEQKFFREKSGNDNIVDTRFEFDDVLEWLRPSPDAIETGRYPVELSLLPSTEGINATLQKKGSFIVSQSTGLAVKKHFNQLSNFLPLNIGLNKDRATLFCEFKGRITSDSGELPVFADFSPGPKSDSDTRPNDEGSQTDEAEVADAATKRAGGSKFGGISLQRQLKLLLQEKEPGYLVGILYDKIGADAVRIAKFRAGDGEGVLQLEPQGFVIVGYVELFRVRSGSQEADYVRDAANAGQVTEEKNVAAPQRLPAKPKRVVIEEQEEDKALLKHAKQGFENGNKYLENESGQAFAISLVEDVAGDVEMEKPKVTLDQVIKNYVQKKDFRNEFFEAINSFVAFQNKRVTNEQIKFDDRKNFEATLLPKSKPKLENEAYKSSGLTAFLEAELLFASQALLNALDKRFNVAKKPQSASPEKGRGDDNPNEKSDPIPQEYADVESARQGVSLYDKATKEAGRALSSWWLIARDVSALDRGDSGRPALESLYLRILDKRIQTRLNAGKTIFNESARDSKNDEEIKDKRALAEVELQRLGFEAYLSAGVLGGAHESSVSFTESGGGELRTRIGIAARVHSMIRSGKKPDGYIESFIPNRNPIEVYADAVSATVSAIAKENTALEQRQYQLNSLGQIQGELAQQRQAYRDPLQQLCGFQFKPNEIKIGDEVFPHPTELLKDDATKNRPLRPWESKDRILFLNLVDKRIASELKAHVVAAQANAKSAAESVSESIRKERSLELDSTLSELQSQSSGVKSFDIKNLPVSSFGMLGSAAIDVERSVTRVQQSYLALEHIVREVNDEKWYVAGLRTVDQEKLRKTRSVIKRWSKNQQVLAALQVVYSSTTVTTGVATGVSTNPLQAHLAVARALEVELGANRDLELEDIRATADEKKLSLGLERTIRDLVRRFEMALKSLEDALLELEQARNTYALTRVQLRSLVEDWAVAKEISAERFVGYAAQAVKRQSSRIIADQALNDARKSCYLAAKALQYVWVERFANPVPVMGTGTDVVLPKKEFRIFTNPESVLGARNANELRDFLEALYAWHKTLSSGLRGSPRGNETRFTKMISLRKDILGFDEFVARPNEVGADLEETRSTRIKDFREWMAPRIYRSRGEISTFAFEFATEIDSDRIFSRDEWNQKIIKIGVNFRGQLPAAAPTVSLTQSGTVSVRRFPPIFQNIERYSLSGYGLNELSEAFERPAEQRTYDKIAEVQIHAAREDFMDNPKHRMSDALVDMSVAADRWALSMDFSDPANRMRDGTPFPIENLTDIEFIFLYSFNHPNEGLSSQLQREFDRLSAFVEK